MKKLIIIGALAVTTMFGVFSVKADNIAYMGVNGGDFGTIDLNTGVFTLLGNSGQSLAGLAVDNGMLYGSSWHTVDSTGQLFTINPANGSLTSVGTKSNVNYDDFGSTTFGLYAVGVDANLYSINPNTGAPSLIGPIGIGFGSWRSLSTNSSTLYFADGANLYTLSTTTGAATLVGNMGGPEIGALLMEGGSLYGGQETPAPLAVDTLNPVTGVATTGPALSGTSSAFFALAPNPLPVPEPSTWSMIGVGGVALLGIILRKKRRTA
jgi:hypothetical protein